MTTLFGTIFVLAILAIALGARRPQPDPPTIYIVQAERPRLGWSGFVLFILGFIAALIFISSFTVP